jgi:DNA-binding GntR family transcriptional regulator
MTESEVNDLQQLLQDHEDKISKDRSYYQQAGDVDFHYRIILGSKNNHMINLLVHGIYHLVRMYRVKYGMAGPRVTTALVEHQHIVTAIKNKDGELAELLMRRHIMYSKESIKKKLAASIGN